MLYKITLSLIIVSLISAPALGAFVEKIRSNHALIILEGLDVKPGDELMAVTTTKVVRLRVTKVGHIKAAADMLDGFASAGSKVYSANDPEIEIAQNGFKKKKSRQHRRGISARIGYDFANKYIFNFKDPTIGKITLTTSTPIAFAAGYQVVEKDNFGWDANLNYELKRTAQSIQSSVGTTSQSLSSFDHTIVGLEANANYGFSAFDSLLYVFGGVGKYSLMFSDSSMNGSMLGLQIGIGGFVSGNFNFDLAYRYLMGTSSSADLSMSGLLVHIGYLFDL